jgi:hypothetical protein
MVQQQQSNITSSQLNSLIKQFDGKDGDNFRRDFLVTQLQLSLAEQLKSMRGDMTQEQFSNELGKPQSVICRLENPDTPKSINSLLAIAHKRKIALLVRFVDFHKFLEATGDYSQEAMAPIAYDKLPTKMSQQDNMGSKDITSPQVSYNEITAPLLSARDSYSYTPSHAPYGHNGPSSAAYEYGNNTGNANIEYQKKTSVLGAFHENNF